MNRKRKLILMAGMVLLILLCIHPKTMAFIEGKFKPESGSLQLEKELKLPHSSQIQYVKMGQYLVQYWDGMLYAYQGDGNQYWTLPIKINQPKLEGNEGGLLLLDEETLELARIDAQGALVYQVHLRQSVGSLSISDQGHALIYYTPGEGPLRNVAILSPEGETLGEITLNEGEILKTCISGSGERVFLYTLGVKSEGLVGQLQVYNHKGELLAIEKLPNEISLWMAMGKDQNLYLATDLSLRSYTLDGIIRWSNPLQGIHRVKENNFQLLGVLFKEQSSKGIFNSKVGDKGIVFNYNGESMGEMSLSEAMIGMDFWEEQLLLNGNRSLYLYDAKGNQQLSYSYSGDIEGAWMMPGNQIIVLTREKLSFYKFE